MKANSRSFPKITEVSVDFKEKQISLSDIVSMGWIFGYPMNVDNQSGISARKGWFRLPFWERKVLEKKFLWIRT